MNNKGFTLIELIATIALLAVVVSISFVSINAVIKSNKKEQCNNLISSIEAATKEYVSDVRYNEEFLDGPVNRARMEAIITGSEIINGYLNSPVINPITNQEISPTSISITVSLNDNYTVKEIKSISGISCE